MQRGGGGNEPFILGPEQSRGSAGEPWRTRVVGANTGGLLVIGDAVMPPMWAGASLLVHSHDDEASLVVAGVLTVVLGDDESAPASTGSRACYPPRVGTSPHPYRIASHPPSPVLMSGIYRLGRHGP
jgi:hypothetical protein